MRYGLPGSGEGRQLGRIALRLLTIEDMGLFLVCLHMSFLNSTGLKGFSFNCICGCCLACPVGHQEAQLLGETGTRSDLQSHID